MLRNDSLGWYIRWLVIETTNMQGFDRMKSSGAGLHSFLLFLFYLFNMTRRLKNYRVCIEKCVEVGKRGDLTAINVDYFMV